MKDQDRLRFSKFLHKNRPDLVTLHHHPMIEYGRKREPEPFYYVGHLPKGSSVMLFHISAHTGEVLFYQLNNYVYRPTKKRRASPQKDMVNELIDMQYLSLDKELGFFAKDSSKTADKESIKEGSTD